MKFLITSFLFTASAVVSAETYKLKLDANKVYSGSSSINIKQEIRKSFPNVEINKFRLKRVVVLAKSARGKGKIQLRIGDFMSRQEIIDGNRDDFNRRGQFNRIVFESPRQERGPWRLLFNGRVKIRNINVVATKDSDNNDGGNNNAVTKSCTYQLEFFWGDNIEKFEAQATARNSARAQAQACERAKNRCELLKFPLTRCVRL